MISLGEYIAQRLRGSTATILTLLSLILSAIGTYGTYLSLYGPNVPDWFIYIAGLFPFALVAWIVFREIDLARRRRYAPSLSELRACFRSYQDLCALLREYDTHASLSETDVRTLQKAFNDHLTQLLTAFAQTFTIITGVPCRACIKIIPSEQLTGANTDLEDVVVVALARDRESQESNLQSDRDRFERRSDKIVSNSDFETLYNPGIADHGYYLCNSIPRSAKHGRYRNSSVQYRRAQSAVHDVYDEDRYVLPYRSSITWPIRYQSHSQDESIFIGFLSVDAPARRIFDRRWDPPLGKLLAAALFEPLYWYSDLIRRPPASSPATQIQADVAANLSTTS